MAGTTLFALIAGLYYWWPKITKRMYNEKFGVAIFFVSFVGFNTLYFPYFFLMAMPRRISTFSVASGFASANLTATIGAYIFGPAAALAVLNLVLSLRKPPSAGANPWDGNEMEWTNDYSGSLAKAPNEVTAETAGDPTENTRSSRWYWCRSGSCAPSETTNKTGSLKTPVEAEA